MVSEVLGALSSGEDKQNPCVCVAKTDGGTVLLAAKRSLLRGSSAPLSPPLFSDSLPWWLSPGSSGGSPAAANKPTGEINQRGGVPVSAGATNMHLFRKLSGSEKAD